MSVIGIDPSVDHPALAIWPAKETWQFRIKGEGSARFDALFCELRGWCANNAPDDLQAVFIERPTGGFNNPTLYQANGIIQVAMMRGLIALYPHPPTVFEISPRTWKKEAIGSGRAKKDDVMKWARNQVWDQKDLPPPSNLTQDTADALAISCAGYKLLSTERETTGGTDHA